MSRPPTLAAAVTPLSVAARMRPCTAHHGELPITEASLDVWHAWDGTLTWILTATTPEGPRVVVGREPVRRRQGGAQEAVAAAVRHIREHLRRWATQTLVLLDLVPNSWFTVEKLRSAAAPGGFGVHVERRASDWPTPTMRAMTALREDIKASHAIRYTPLPVNVATDASMRRGARVAGIAFVTDHGDLAHDAVPVRDTFEAEVRAIILGMSTVAPRAGRPLLVRTDSRSAQRFVQAVLLGRAHAHLGPTSPKLPGLADVILRRARRFPAGVQVRWTRGHAGDVLNNCADRLARLARRERTEHGYDVATMRRVAAEVAQMAKATRYDDQPLAG